MTDNTNSFKHKLVNFVAVLDMGELQIVLKL